MQSNPFDLLDPRKPEISAAGEQSANPFDVLDPRKPDSPFDLLDPRKPDSPTAPTVPPPGEFPSPAPQTAQPSTLEKSVDQGAARASAGESSVSPTLPPPPIPEPITAAQAESAVDPQSLGSALFSAVPRGAVETGALPLEVLSLNRRLAQGMLKDFESRARGAQELTPEEFNTFQRDVVASDIPASLKIEIVNAARDVREGRVGPGNVRSNVQEGDPVGAALKGLREFIAFAFPISEENEQRLPVQVARGVGSTAGFLAARVLLGPAGLALFAGGAGAGEAIQTAIHNGASDEQAARAGLLGVAPGLTDIIPIERLLRPVSRIPGVKGALYAIARKAIEQGLIEGTQESVQQIMQNAIAKITSKPDQEISQDIAQNGLVGFLVGALFGSAAGIGAQPRATSEELRDLMEDERSVEQIRRADKKAAREAEKAAPVVALTPDMEVAPIDLTPDMEVPGPVKVETPVDVQIAEAQADPAPTEGQKEAGNYKKGHVNFKGLDISIENPAGSERTGVGKDGQPWSVTMRVPYGYVKRSEGADGEQVDVYLGYDTRSDTAFVFDQHDPETGKFDEHKVVLGATDLGDAEFVYDVHFSDDSGPTRRRGVTALTIDEFKTWLKDGDTKKPLAPAPGPAAPVEQGKSPAAVRAPRPPEAPSDEGWESAAPKATAFVRQKDGGKVTPRMLMTRFDLNKAQAQRLHGHLRSQGILTQKGYAHAKITKPRDVLDIIKGMGGIKPDGDLRAMDLNKARPGVLRKNGRSVSAVREHLEELGMIPQDSYDDVVYDEIGRALRKERGRPFHPADEDLVREIEVEEAEDENERFLDDARSIAAEAGVVLDDEDITTVARSIAQGQDADFALEAVVLAQEREAAQEYLDETPDEEEIPFDVPVPVAVEPQPRRDGEVAPQEGPGAARPARTEAEDEQGGQERRVPGEAQGEEDLLAIPDFLNRAKAAQVEPAPNPDKETAAEVLKRHGVDINTLPEIGPEGIRSIGAQATSILPENEERYREVLPEKPTQKSVHIFPLPARRHRPNEQNFQVVLQTVGGKLTAFGVANIERVAASGKPDIKEVFYAEQIQKGTDAAPVTIEEVTNLAKVISLKENAHFDPATNIHTAQQISAPKPDLRNKEIGEVIGADEREKPRDAEREKREIKARTIPTKIRSAKEQKEPDEGLFRERETPLEKAVRKKGPTPQVAAIPGMTPLGVPPPKEPSPAPGKAPAKAGVSDSGKKRLSKAKTRRATKVGAILSDLRAELDKLGLTDVKLKVEEIEGERDALDQITEIVAGTYDKGEIMVNPASADRRRTLSHEAIHAMKDMDLFTVNEWVFLSEKAQNEWLDKYDTRRNYDELGLAAQREEAIADAFGDWYAGAQSARGRIGRIFVKIKKFLHAIAKVLRINGIETSVDLEAADTFERIATGEVGRRERLGRAGERGPKLSIEKMQPTFDDPKIEARWKEASKGMGDQRAMGRRFGDYMTHIGHGFARHYLDLPNTAKFAKAHETLRQFEAAKPASQEEAVRLLKTVTRGFTAEDLALFTRKVVLDDLAYEEGLQHDLPFGFTEDSLARNKDIIDAAVDSSPKLKRALAQRQKILDVVKRKLISADILEAERANNPAYFRHQVLVYARVRQMYFAGKSLKIPKPGYAKKREGSIEDINANYLEVEFEYLNRALIDLATVKAIERVKKEYDTHDQVQALAKAANARAMTEIAAKDPDVQAKMDGWRQNIAMGLSIVAKDMERDQSGVPEEFTEVVEDLIDSHRRKKADLADEAEDITQPGSESEQLFPFLNWLTKRGGTGSGGAAVVFKAITERRNFVKKTLTDAKKWTTFRDHVPEGDVTWQPEKGNYFFVAKSMPEHIVDRLLEVAETAGLPGVPAGEVQEAIAKMRDVFALGAPKYEMVIPEELAATLDRMRPATDESFFDHVLGAPLKWWKRWVLINPRRVLRYNLNNLSGDLDAVIAGNPKAVKKLPRAIKELRGVMHGAEPSARYKEAVERGVFNSAFSIQEIPDINFFAPFEEAFNKPKFTEEPGRWALRKVRQVWRVLKDYTQFRENWLRYAAYLDYVERLEAGESMEGIGYGASKPEIVDALGNPKDRAGLLARELVGDYGNISHFGQHIRAKVVPFYSWWEINLGRYLRFLANAWSQGLGGKGRALGYTTAKGVRITAYLGIRMMFLYAMVTLYNQLFHGDDEDELDTEDRARLHINLGRDDAGEMRLLRFQGAFSDFAGWFGMENAVAVMREIDAGRADWTDLAEAIPKGPVNRIVTGVSPLLRTPFELASGQTFWPDVFNPRPFKGGRIREALRLFSLENEYDWLTGRPTRGYAESLQRAVVSKRNVREDSYFQIRTLSREYMEREHGITGMSTYESPRSQALYEWKLARRFGDKEAEKRLFKRMAELGVKRKSLRASIKRAHPLGNIPKRERRKFYGTLTKKERAKFNKAMEWYREVFGGRSNAGK